MTGHVENDHALLSVTLRVENQADIAIEFVVDTGFVGELTLPLAAIDALGLRWIHDMDVNLADDSVIELPVYAATILWNGQPRIVRILGTGKRPLLGMTLLAGSELVVQCHNYGLVTDKEI